jgi:hypothetical protein
MEMGTATTMTDLGSMRNEGFKRRDEWSRNQTLITRQTKTSLDYLLRSIHIERKAIFPLAIQTPISDYPSLNPLTSLIGFQLPGDLGAMELRSREDGTVTQ